MSSLTKLSFGLMALVLLMSSSVNSQSKSVLRNIKSIPNPRHTVEYSEPIVAVPVVINPKWIPLNPIINGIENIRTLLGGGRHIALNGGGNVHVTGLQGTGATYSLFYSNSTDNGVTWHNYPNIGRNAIGGRDRYPAIAVKGTKVNIAFHDQINGTGYVAKNPDPLGGDFEQSKHSAPEEPLHSVLQVAAKLFQVTGT